MVPTYEHARAVASSRAHSQDAVGLFERDGLFIVVLADGGGGMRGGGTASRSLVAVVESAVRDPLFVVDQMQPWLDLFRATDAGLAANRAGETTGVVVVLGPRRIFGVGIGDTEAWVVSPTAVDNLTVGQQTGERLGRRHAAMAVFERPALTGVLVVATDGLFKFAATEVIANVVRTATLADAANRLVELVRFRSGKVADDVAVVLVRDRAASTGPS